MDYINYTFKKLGKIPGGSMKVCNHRTHRKIWFPTHLAQAAGGANFT
jgi:hypothetical protein